MESSDDDDNKKDKKLVFLSKTVLQKVRERPMVTGTQIANEIFELYSNFVTVSETQPINALNRPKGLESLF